MYIEYYSNAKRNYFFWLPMFAYPLCVLGFYRSWKSRSTKDLYVALNRTKKIRNSYFILSKSAALLGLFTSATGALIFLYLGVSWFKVNLVQSLDFERELKQKYIEQIKLYRQANL